MSTSKSSYGKGGVPALCYHSDRQEDGHACQQSSAAAHVDVPVGYMVRESILIGFRYGENINQNRMRFRGCFCMDVGFGGTFSLASNRIHGAYD